MCSYSYDYCTSERRSADLCYHPNIKVTADYINIRQAKDAPLHVRLRFKDGEHNMQIPVKKGDGLGLKLTYSPQPMKPPQPPIGGKILGVFFGSLCAYFVIGALVQKYKFQQTGSMLIPNRAFWFALPGLIAEGCRCVLGISTCTFAPEFDIGKRHNLPAGIVRSTCPPPTAVSLRWLTVDTQTHTHCVCMCVLVSNLGFRTTR